MDNFSPSWCKPLVKLLSIIIVLAALFILAIPGFFNVHPIIAFNFLVTGFALYLLRDEDTLTHFRSVLSSLLIMLSLFISILILTNDFFKFNYLAWGNHVHKEALTADVSFILIAIGLIIINFFKNPKMSLIQIAVILFTISLFSLAQSVFNVNSQYVPAVLTEISPIYSLLFILFSIALPLTRPNVSFTSMLISDSTSGKYARRILFAVSVVPFAISYLENIGEMYQLYDPDFGDAMILSLSIFFMIIIVFISTKAFHDQEESTLKTEKSLHYLTYYDDVTNVLNRHGFLEFLKDLLTRPNNKLITVFKLNLNQLDMISHIAGFEATNDLLRQLVDRYTTLTAEYDITLARISQHQFAFSVINVNDIEDISLLASKVLQLTSDPLILNGKEVTLTGSMGISISPDDGKTAESLLDAAFVALVQAQKQSGNHFQFCTPYLTFSLAERLEIERALQEGISHNKFQLYYQPQLNLMTGRLSGAEALLRWHHPKQGLVSPAFFIKIAEETNLIIPIGEWIIREACRQIKNGWPFLLNPSSNELVTLAVNVSIQQLNPSYPFVEKFKQIIQEFNIDPHLIELEITESLFMKDMETNLKSLTELKKMGFKLAIDDFGTGYSSFNYFTRLPNDYIKIDKSFIDRIQHHENDITIVRAIIVMSHELGKKVIAEGVEDEAQMKLLKEAKCDYIQGNYYSAALSLEEFKLFVNEKANEKPIPL